VSMTPAQQTRANAAKIASDLADEHRAYIEPNDPLLSRHRVAANDFEYLAERLEAMPLPAEPPAIDGLAEDLARALEAFVTMALPSLTEADLLQRDVWGYEDRNIVEFDNFPRCEELTWGQLRQARDALTAWRARKGEAT
jgi:hypothetical protein